MKRLMLTLLVLLIAAPLALGAVAGASYYTTTEGQIPSPVLKVADQSIFPNGHEWQEPVFGGILHKEFEDTQRKDGESIGVIEQPQLTLEVPEGYSATAVVSYDGEEVFSGSAEQLQSHTFVASGVYEARLACERKPSDSGAYGTLLYDFDFEVKLNPIMEAQSSWVYPGEVIGITLSQLSDSAVPTAQSSLGEFTFVPSASGCITALLPVPVNSEIGSYDANVRVSGESWDVPMRVTDASFPTADSRVMIDEVQDEEFFEEFERILRDTDDERHWEGAFEYPSQGELLMSFGTYLSDGEYPERHIGVDITDDEGSPIVAPAAGRVVYAGELGSMGNTLVIEHGYGLKSVFFYLDEILTEQGMFVQKGEEVAAMGNSGVSNMAHLHYELWLGDVPINPTTLFNGTSPITRIGG